MDFVIVNPSLPNPMGEFAAIEPPIWCVINAGVTQREGKSAVIIDADLEQLTPQQTAQRILKHKPRVTLLLAMGANPSASSTPKMDAIIEISHLLKGKTAIGIGGLHAVALPTTTLRQCDADFIITAPLMQSLIDLPSASWGLLPMNKYRAHNWHCLDGSDRGHYGVIYTSYGCPFNCSYCNVHTIYGGKAMVKYRKPQDVVDEIGLLVKKYSVRNLKFADELFTIREDRIQQLCDLLIKQKYNLNIWAYARAEMVNPWMLKKMKKAGINWLCYGFESASADVLEGVSKGDQYGMMKQAVQMTHDAGINIIGNFIFGLPEDNLDTMRDTLSMAKEFNCEYVNFYVAMAYPGSKLYMDALQSGVKLPEKWADYGQFSPNVLPLPTKYLSAEEVLSFRDMAFQDYFNDKVYQDLIGRKFGDKAVKHIKKMLGVKIR